MRAFIRENDIDQIATVHGPYDKSEVSSVLTHADLVLLPSLWEGLPLVLVEAMQRGVPVVATRAGGTVELGNDNPDCIITDISWEAFTDGLCSMARKLRHGEIDHARLQRRTEAKYGYECVSLQWLDCLTNPKRFFNLG